MNFLLTLRGDLISVAGRVLKFIEIKVSRHFFSAERMREIKTHDSAPCIKVNASEIARPKIGLGRVARNEEDGTLLVKNIKLCLLISAGL